VNKTEFSKTKNKYTEYNRARERERERIERENETMNEAIKKSNQRIFKHSLFVLN
jgi:hypothetical protein